MPTLKILGLPLWQWGIVLTLLMANALILGIFAMAVIAKEASPPTPVVQLITATPTRTSVFVPAATLKPILVVTATPTTKGAPTFTRQPASSPLSLTPSRTPTSISTSALPPQARVWNVVGSPQVLALSCEAHIAVVLASHYGVQIDEIEFFRRLPVSDNPEAGFVGDVNGSWGQTPPNDYGVHAEPVAALMREYKVPATAWKGLTLDDLRAEIAAGRPVGIWVTGHTAPGESLEYISVAGDKVTVARYEHTVLVIGYTPDSFLILDGNDTYYRSLEQFTQSWGALGNMAILRGR